MADKNSFPRTVADITKNPDARLPAHACDAPDLSPKEFLLRVMHDPDVPIKDRLNAASKLLRIYGEHEFAPPTCKVIIGGIPSSYDHGSCSEADHPREGTTENDSQNREIAQIAVTHHPDPQAPVNIETIISDIKSGNFPEPRLCVCGHWMPYPCHPVKIQ